MAAPASAQVADALRQLESRAAAILETHRDAVVAIQVRPATFEVLAASPSLSAATPVLGGGTEDQALITMLARDADGSLRVHSDGSRFPEPASGETFASYLARVTEQSERIWRRSVRRGSGFVLDASGHVATSAHLLRAKRPEDTIMMRMGDRWARARVVGQDAFTGIAVLLAATATSHVPATTPAEPQPGQFVISLQTSLDGGPRVQWGAVTAVERRLPDLERVGYVPFLETSLPLLPGGIGSPAFDIDGRLVGMILDGRRMEGGTLSYILPAWVLRQVAADLVERGAPVHGSLGVDVLAPGRREDRERRKALAVPDSLKGVLIRQVWPAGPAEAAGLAPDDLILAWNGVPLVDWRQLVWLIRIHRPGEKVEISFWRAGESRTASVTMGQPPPRNP